QHPVLRLLDASPASFVGEDIEMSLALLSNYTTKKHFNRESDLLHTAYQKLGLLMDTANRVRDYHTAKFGGVNHKGARVHYNEDDQQAAKVLAFVRNWITFTK